MKKLLAPMMATALIFAGSAAYAADTDAKPAPDGKEHPRGGERFKKADTNQDGFLTKDEMKAQQEKRLDEMFTKTDANKDGKLSQDEMKAGREAMKQKWKERKENKEGGSPSAPPSEDKKE